MSITAWIIIIIVILAIIGILVWVFWPEDQCDENEKDGIKWPATAYGKTAEVCKDRKKYTRVCTSSGTWLEPTSTSSSCEAFTTFDEILVPTYIDENHPQYGNPTHQTFTEHGTVMNLVNAYPYRAQANIEGYPANPDLYPENGVEFRPENNMYIHLENNFLDIGPQIGVGTRVNSQRNAPQLLFRKDFAVPTMPTGYWNQSTISQPIFMNNSC